MDCKELVVPVGALIDHCESVVPRLLAGLDALGVPTAEITDYRLLSFRMKYWYLTGAGLDAERAACALIIVHQHCAGLFFDAEGVHRTALDTRIILALGTEMGHLDPREGHKDPDSRGLGPYPVLVMDTASNFASTASGTIEIISCDPYLIGHILTRIVAFNYASLNKKSLLIVKRDRIMRLKEHQPWAMLSLTCLGILSSVPSIHDHAQEFRLEHMKSLRLPFWYKDPDQH